MSKELIEKYTLEIEACKCDKELATLYLKRAKLYQTTNDLQSAIDDFNIVLKLDKHSKEAKSYLEYIYEILDYRYILFYDV